MARTGLRVGELCALEANAVVRIGATHWLRVPVGKLHDDRYLPLHPILASVYDRLLTTISDTDNTEPGYAGDHPNHPGSPA